MLTAVHEFRLMPLKHALSFAWIHQVLYTGQGRQETENGKTIQGRISKKDRQIRSISC